MQEIVEQEDFIKRTCKPYIQNLLKDLRQKNPENTQPSPANMSLNNSEKNAKYFSQETLDKYVDSYDRNCEVVPCWVCSDTKIKVARENQGLGPVVGFS